MKTKILVLAVLCLSIISCFLFPEKEGLVTMIEGPIFEYGVTVFYYKGVVKNYGSGRAKNVKVYIFVRDSAGTLLEEAYNVADSWTLGPGDTSAWRVSFSDEDYSLRDKMDQSRTTYEIEWEDA